jgi:NADPH2:quinone reductase
LTIPATCRRVVSLLRASGELEVTLDIQATPVPGDGELLLRVEAAPLNPADIKLMFCAIPPGQLTANGKGEARAVRGTVGPGQLAALAARIDVPLAAGNEGAGLVVAAGGSPTAQALLSQRVSVAAGGMFSEYRTVRADDCIVLPRSTPTELGAAAWINPLTALAMVETMRREGHCALVLTAAASNLGRMLNRLCLEDGIPLVNIVRSEVGADALLAMGATHVCNSSAPDFRAQLTDACAVTRATLAFDATGGGRLAGEILRAMEQALAASARGYSRYGSVAHKQLYFFGGLDPAPVVFERNFGMAWGMGGWLLQRVLTELGPETLAVMKDRVVGGLNTIFQSAFDLSIPLSGLADPQHFREFMKLATAGKYLVRPLAK